MASENASNGSVNNAELRMAQTFEEFVHNMWSCRQELIDKLMGPRTDIDQECNYPAGWVQAHFYRSLYDRGAIPSRIVQLMPKEMWQKAPEVFEDESAKSITPFETAWDELGTSLRGHKSWYKDERGSPVWEYLFRADMMSGIGSFGVLLIGIDDGLLLEQPAAGAPQDGQPKDITGVAQDIYGGQLPQALNPTPLMSQIGTDAQYFTTMFAPMQPKPPKGDQRKVLFLRVFDESLVQIVQYESSVRSPRFGMPVMYLITMNDPRLPHTGIGLPLATLRVHWSRVVHLAENLENSEIFAAPRMRPVLNNVLDLRKLYGGSAEMYWRGAFPGLSLETHPQLGGDVIVDRDSLAQMMHDYQLRLNRWISLMGMSAKSLAPQVTDPTPQITTQLEAICIQLGCPVRVFKGSERGELASSQDDDAWLDRVRHRQDMYATPRVVVPFVDRLIMLKCLPEPDGFSVKWPALDCMGRAAKAQVALTRTQALVAYVGGNVETIYPPNEYFTRELDMTEEEAETILDSAKDNQDTMTMPPSGEQGHPATPPPPPPKFVMPGQKPPGAGGGAPNGQAPKQPAAPRPNPNGAAP